MDRPALKEEVLEEVINVLDIDQTLRQAAQEVHLKGRRVLQEIQAQQRDDHEKLTKQVAEQRECTQRLKDEHLRLKGVAQDLVRWLAPLSSSGVGVGVGVGVGADAAVSVAGVSAPGLGPCPAVAAAAPEHTHGGGTGAVAGAGAGAMATSGAGAGTSNSTTETTSTYSVQLRKADGCGVGLEVCAYDGPGLLIQRLQPGGLVEAWNRRCEAESDSQRAICPGDCIVLVNDAQTPETMLREFEHQWLLRLTLARSRHASQAVQSMSLSMPMRPDAPEFLPERQPLQSRQLPVIPEDIDADTDADSAASEHGESFSCKVEKPLGPKQLGSCRRGGAATAMVDKENMAHFR